MPPYRQISDEHCFINDTLAFMYYRLSATTCQNPWFVIESRRLGTFCFWRQQAWKVIKFNVVRSYERFLYRLVTINTGEYLDLVTVLDLVVVMFCGYWIHLWFKQERKTSRQLGTEENMYTTDILRAELVVERLIICCFRGFYIAVFLSCLMSYSFLSAFSIV